MNILVVTLLIAHTHEGVATQYVEEGHIGNPLYCDRGDGLVYDRSVGPWVAVGIQDIEAGRYACGDVVTVYLEDGTTITAPVLDAGNLHTRTFRGGLSIVVDVPEYWATWQKPVPKARVVNWDAMSRECVERGWCD